MVRLDLQPELEADLVAEAQARGLPVERYLEEIVVARPVVQAAGSRRSKTVREAIDRILELREGTSLGGLSIKDLINEGRKY